MHTQRCMIIYFLLPHWNSFSWNIGTQNDLVSHFLVSPLEHCFIVYIGWAECFVSFFRFSFIFTTAKNPVFLLNFYTDLIMFFTVSVCCLTIPPLSDKASCALGVWGTWTFQQLSLGCISFAHSGNHCLILIVCCTLFIYTFFFCRCLLLKDKKVEGILLTCLLIPTAHINTLAYLMQVKIWNYFVNFYHSIIRHLL
jgi:hypothetical protein